MKQPVAPLNTYIRIRVRFQTTEPYRIHYTSVDSAVARLNVIPSETSLGVEDHTELRQLDKSTFGGSHYDATDFMGFRMRKIWIFPVTLCVLGCYPKYLYIKKVA